MSSDLFFNSVIKGLGKTTGTMIILGVIGGTALYLSSSSAPRKMKMKKRVKESKETQTNTEVQLENVDEILEIPDETQHTPKRFLESENNYKKIFDKL